MNSNCDADGQRVRKDDPNGTTAYAGPGFEQNAYTGVQRVTYSFNGQVVAVRNGATTSWLHSDHLGSASLATDYTGVPVAGSDTRYTPWGEVRVGGTLPTDRGFTSQRREDNIRLNDYVARFYNPFIGKFIQPDSVVPGAGNPQAFNRFAYVFNNPLALTDPTGHDPWWREQWDSAQNVLNFAKDLKGEVITGETTPVKALASLSDRAWAAFNGVVSEYIWVMTLVLMGFDPTTYEPSSWYGRTHDERNTIRSSRGWNSYWVGYEWLPHLSGKNTAESWPGDWRRDYFDGSSDQAYHFWAYVSITFYESALWAMAGNIRHEDFLMTRDNRRRLQRVPVIGASIDPDDMGVSIEDTGVGRSRHYVWCPYDNVAFGSIAGLGNKLIE